MAPGTFAQRAAARAFRPALPRLNGMMVLATIPAVIIVGLLFLTLWISVFYDAESTGLGNVFSLENYVTLYTDPFALRAAWNTAQLAVASLVVAFALGVPIAWLVERSDLPGKSVINTFMVIGILIPGFFTAMGWIFLLHPRIGMFNVWIADLFGLQQGPLSIATPIGMGWLLGLGVSSLVYVLTASSLRAMDSSLEEAAQVAGASFLTTLRFITLPLIWPALLASALYVVTIAISAFDIPLVIGLSNQIYTFSTYLFVKTQPTSTGAPPDYGVPAAFATFMVALGIFLSWWYSRTLSQARKYQVITGKNYKPKLVPLGRWAPLAWVFLVVYVLLGKILPILLLLWASLQPFFRPVSLDAMQFISLKHFENLNWSGVQRGLEHTAILMILAPTLALAMSLVSSWVVLRTRNRFRMFYDYMAFMPHAVPSVIFGLAALYVALKLFRGPVDLYGSMGLLVIILAITQLSFGSRVTNGALIQIHNELEEAAYVSGAKLWDVLRRVTLPLLRPAFVYAWLWMALFAFRELTLATMLFGPDNMTLSVFIWTTWNTGSTGQASAIVILMMALMVPLVLLYLRYGAGSRIRV